MSFYRIYRPLTISEIDNPVVREKFLALLSKDKQDLPHAFLFVGPRGAGKTTAARIVAKLLNCAKPEKNGAPCGKCEQCKSIAAGTNLDVLEIDAASNRGIDEIRALRESIHLLPSAAAYKVYIIDEVHMLTTEAFNALLKTLEEPPPHAVFILATTDPQKLPATVKSRCVIIEFSRAKDEDLLAALRRIVKAEKLAVTEEGLSLISRFADGSFRDAVKLLEQLSLTGKQITVGLVETELSISGDAACAQFIDSVLNTDAATALRQIADQTKQGVDVKFFLAACLKHLQRELVQQAQSDQSGSKKQLTHLIGLLVRAYEQLRLSPIPELPLELAVVEYCQTQSPPDPSMPATRSASAAHKPVVVAPEAEFVSPQIPAAGQDTSDLLNFSKLVEHWPDLIADIKQTNHSLAGMLRSARPELVADGIVTIAAFYTFHRDRLAEARSKDALASSLKKLFGVKVKVDIVLGKK